MDGIKRHGGQDRGTAGLDLQLSELCRDWPVIDDGVTTLLNVSRISGYVKLRTLARQLLKLSDHATLRMQDLRNILKAASLPSRLFFRLRPAESFRPLTVFKE